MKLSPCAGSRIGWAIVEDEAIAQLMRQHVSTVSGYVQESQLRATALLEYVLSTNGTEGISFALFSYCQLQFSRIQLAHGSLLLILFMYKKAFKPTKDVPVCIAHWSQLTTEEAADGLILIDYVYTAFVYLYSFCVFRLHLCTHVLHGLFESWLVCC